MGYGCDCATASGSERDRRELRRWQVLVLVLVVQADEGGAGQQRWAEAGGAVPECERPGAGAAPAEAVERRRPKEFEA